MDGSCSMFPMNPFCLEPTPWPLAVSGLLEWLATETDLTLLAGGLELKASERCQSTIETSTLLCWLPMGVTFQHGLVMIH